MKNQKKSKLTNLLVKSFSTSLKLDEHRTVQGKGGHINITFQDCSDSIDCTEGWVKVVSRIGGSAPGVPLACKGVNFGRRVVYESLHGIFHEPTVCAICPPGGNGATTDGPIGVACGVGCHPI